MLEVAVIGGGVVGASAAYHLLRSGARVTVVDRADAGQATAAGAGILPALDHFSDSEALLPLLRAARAHYSTLCRALAAEGERDAGYAVVGALHVALRDAERPLLERAAAEARAFADAGMAHVGEVRELDSHAARALFPLLGPVAGAVHCSGAARIDGRRLLSALRGAVTARGGRWRRGSADVQLDRQRALRVLIDGEQLNVDRVVVAAGSWSRQLASSLDVRLPVEPQRGQLIHLELPDVDTAAWPIVMGFGWNYLLGFPGGRVVAGATREDAGHDARITAAGVHAVLASALELAPHLGAATLGEVRVGFRPVTEDGNPIIGRAPSHPDVFFATGHGGYGLELGPYSGALVAELVMERAVALNLEAFDVRRFQR